MQFLPPINRHRSPFPLESSARVASRRHLCWTLPERWTATLGRPCESTKILPDQINLRREAFEHLSRSDQIGFFRGHFQLPGGFLGGTRLKCSNRALECVSCLLDHPCIARIKAFPDLPCLLFACVQKRFPFLKHPQAQLPTDPRSTAYIPRDD